MTGPATLSIVDVGHAFMADSNQTGLLVLDSLSFDVARASVVAIVGPSGSGKSTLLRAIAGLLQPTSGTILVDGHLVTGAGRDRILLFQDLHLYYWMTVGGNVGFALRAADVPHGEHPKLIAQLLDFVGLTGFSEYYPSQLSGGMRQRLALARALASQPRVLLMDEPFAALDTSARQHLEMEFQALLERRPVTTVFVTHDISQALFMSDRVILLSGRPATVRHVVDVPFPRPRQAQLRRTMAFEQLQDQLSDPDFGVHIPQ